MSRPIPALPQPLTVADIRTACAMGPQACEAFEEACRGYHGAQAAFAVSSARAALWLALRALKALFPERNRVILPAYTCPTVGRAVLAAGLEGLCVDISAEDLNLDAEQVEAHLSEEVLAVIAAHMFGTPCDLPRLAAACRRSGAFLIEDAAQACGARFAGQRVGSFGEMAVLSLGRSKNLRGAGGGVLLVNREELIEPVTSLVAELPDSTSVSATGVLKQLAVTVCSAPWLWNLVRRVSWLHIGAEDQRFDPAPARLAAWKAGLGLLALDRVDEYNARRTQLGQALERELAGLPGVQVQVKLPPRQSAYVRLALRLSVSQPERDTIAATLRAQGIDAWPFYTRTMPAYDWWPTVPDQPACAEAERILASNVVVPVRYAMDERDALRITHTLGDALCLPNTKPAHE